MNLACQLHGHEDSACVVARLVDENEQLREELRQLRSDYEHALTTITSEALK